MNIDNQKEELKIKAFVSSFFRLILCGIETLGLGIFVSIPGTNSIDLVTVVQTPDCLRNLVVKVNANPSNIAYGQSSLVSWSVKGPSECVQTSVQLNGKPVASSGSQTVWLSQSTTYHVTVFYTLYGVPGEKTASVHVTVNDASSDLSCPNIPLLSNVEIWEPDPQINPKQPDLLAQWLNEVVNTPYMSILPSPNVILDFRSVSNNDIPLTVGPGITLMSLCTFMPDTIEPHLDGLIIEGNDPATAPSTT